MGTEKKRIILLLSKYLERDDIRDIEGLSIDGIVRGKQQHATIEEVEHDLGRHIARSGIQAGKGLVQNHRATGAQQGSSCPPESLATYACTSIPGTNRRSKAAALEALTRASAHTSTLSKAEAS